MKMKGDKDCGVAIRPIDVSTEPIKLYGKSVQEALAEILTITGDESLEVSATGRAYSTVGRRVYSKLPSRLATTSTLTTAGTSIEDDNKSLSTNQSVEICSYRSSVLVKSRMSDVSSIRTTANTATSNTTPNTQSVSKKKYATLSHMNSDDAQGSVEVNLSGRPVSSTTTNEASTSSDEEEANVEVDSTSIVAYVTDRHYHHQQQQRPTLDISSLECATSKDDPVEQSSNNLPTSRATNVASNAATTKINMLTQLTKTSNHEHCSYEVDLQAIVFNRTSSSLTSKSTRMNMEKKITLKTMKTISRSKNQSYGNEDSSHEVDLEDLVVVRTTGSSEAQQANTKPVPQRSLASKIRSDAAGQSSSHEVELEDILQFTTAPTRITSNMTSEQQPKTNLPSPSCLLPSKSKSSYTHERFEVEDLTFTSTRTIEFENNGSYNSDDDSLLLKEDEKEISLMRSTTAPENYTLLQVVEVPQVPFMGREQQSSSGGGGVDTEKLLIRKTSTHDTEEDDMFDEEAQSEAAFEVTVHDSEQTIAIMLLEEWMESTLHNSGKRQQQQWDTCYRVMKQVVWSLVVVLIVAGILSAASPIIMRSF